MESVSFREIFVLDRNLDENLVYPSNKISTAKYTALSFIPVSLFEQFYRIANIWFLIVSVLQVLPFDLSPLSSWGTISPLCFILFVSMSKDAYNFYKRLKYDKEINEQRVPVLECLNSDFVDIAWEDIRVGSLVKLNSEDPTPADIVLLSSGDESGVVYVQTSNLDGEKNLKLKQPLKETAVLFEDTGNLIQSLNHLKEAVLIVEQPNNLIYSFLGYLKLKKFPNDIQINIDNLILRGSKIKHTKSVLGLVVFTGPDTKLMRNSFVKFNHKNSSVESKLNQILWYILIVILGISLISMILSVVYWYENPARNMIYGQNISESYLNIFTFMILYNNLMPISLYVTLDIVKLIQAKFIEWDLDLYSDRPAVVKNSDLNEELGQVEYIFADKTGTLTENVMEFKKCWINGKSYGKTIVENKTYKVDHPKFNFEDQEFIKLLDSPDIQDFLQAMGMCHTVKCDANCDYQAINPDEKALVIAAHCFGYTFKRNCHCPTLIELETDTEIYKYSEIGVNEFNSNRKRMSIVVEFYDSDYQPMIICKGADDVMLPLLNQSDPNIKRVKKALSQFGKEGLRTLVYARRFLTAQELKEFKFRYQAASNSISDTKKVLEKIAEDYESNMDLLGITGIEDKIQEGVIETLEKLKKAGIKFWMVTGDNKETAKNIAYSSNLFNYETKILSLHRLKNDNSYKSINRDKIVSTDIEKNLMIQILKYLYPRYYNEDMENSKDKLLELLNRIEKDKIPIECDYELGLVMDGVVLAKVLEKIENIKYFCMLSGYCSSVICYRISPVQKSQILKLVQGYFSFNPVVLAIGDGSNDVCMIQDANIGIGIMGKEGMQAANSSDYAICKFKHLVPLLLIHGRWNYSRITRVVLISFFKNFLMVLPMFYYTFLNFYSGNCLYYTYLIMFYNILMTSLPIIVLGFYDRDLDKNTIKERPDLYVRGVFSELMNTRKYIEWTGIAILCSLIVFIICIYSIETIGKEGFTEGYTLTGTVTFMTIVLTALGTSFVIMNEWSSLFIISELISLALLIILIYLYDATEFPTAEMVGVIIIIFSSPKIMLIIIGVPFINLIFILSIRYIKRFFCPSLIDLALNSDPNNAENSFLQNASRKYEVCTDKRIGSYSSNLSTIFSYKSLDIVSNKHEDQRPDDFKRSKYTRKFLNSSIEKTYCTFRNDRGLPYVRNMILIILFWVVIWNIYGSIAGETISWIATRISILGLMIVIAILVCTKLFTRYYTLFIFCMVIGGLIIKTVIDYINQLDGSMSTAAASIVIFIIIRINIIEFCLIWAVFLVVYFSRVFELYSELLPANKAVILILDYFIIITGISLMSIYVGLTIDNSTRESYIMRKKKDARFKCSTDILSRLLPEFVIKNILNKQTYFSSNYVTILFCEICNFDQICTEFPAEVLMDMLNKYTLILDSLCDKHGVTKIETVNKTYVACCGIGENELDHAFRVVKLALNIINKFQSVYLPECNMKFSVRIGVNSGEIVSGVVGCQKPQFSLVGDTINISSRMCSTIDTPDNIRISDSTYNHVNKEDWVFKKNYVSFKGRKDPIKTYFVYSKRTKSKKNSSGFNEIDVKELIKKIANTADHVPNKIRDLGPDTPAIERKPSIFTIEGLRKYDLIGSDDYDYFHYNKADLLNLASEFEWMVLNLMEKKTQEMYRISFIKRNFKSIQYGLYITALINAFITINILIGSFISNSNNNLKEVCITLRFLCIAVTILISFNLTRLYKHRLYQWLMVILFNIINLISIFSNFLQTELNYVIVLESIFINIAVNHTSGLLFGYILAISIPDLLMWLFLSNQRHLNFFDQTFFVVFSLTINVLASLARYYYDRKNYNIKIKANAAINQNEKLLIQMIPQSVYEKLTSGIPVLDRLENITILYADICGFTSYSEKKSPMDIIKMLSKLFPEFEALSIEYNCYKVHTIGDCYVGLGLSNFNDHDHNDKTESVIKLAFEMVEHIKKFAFASNIRMRIGIHTGNIVAGIVGTKIVRYDIYGPNVDIANKVESSGAPDKVNVSETTKEILERMHPGKYLFQYNQNVHHKATRRTLSTYFITCNSHKD
jgi:phospholipid-transporting ATPase